LLTETDQGELDPFNYLGMKCQLYRGNNDSSKHQHQLQECELQLPEQHFEGPGPRLLEIYADLDNNPRQLEQVCVVDLLVGC
jgi:hypothetical protein